MRRLHTVLFAITVFLSPFVHAEELLSKQTLLNWEFVAATPAAIGTVCTAGEDGVLAITGKPVGYLVTKTEHENYQLHFEWRWPVNAAKNGNGGVLLNISSGPADSTPWPVCFQAQLKMDHAGDLLPMAGAAFAEKLTTAPDAKTPVLEKKEATSEKPAGDWNTGEVVCKDGSIEMTINGVSQNRVTKCAPAAGKVGFQLEGAPFELRNVTLTPLK